MDEFGYLSHHISREEILELVNVSKSRLKTDGFVCSRKLLVLLRHLELEEQNPSVYDAQVHLRAEKLDLPLKPMHLLNFPR